MPSQIWVTELLLKLKKSKLIKKCSATVDTLSITYNTNLTEKYWLLHNSYKRPKDYKILLRKDSRISKIPPISNLSLNVLERDKFCVCLPSHDMLSQYSLIEKRIAIHNLIAQSRNIGVRPAMWSSLIQELSQIFSPTQEIGTNEEGFVRVSFKHGKQNLARGMLVDGKTIKSVYGKLYTREPINILDNCETNGKLLSNMAVLEKLFSNNSATVHPESYARLFKRLGVKSIYDMHPETGSKAIACGMIGAKYYTDHKLVGGLIKFGLFRHLNIDTNLSGSPTTWVISDRNFGKYVDGDVELASKFGRKMIVYDDRSIVKCPSRSVSLRVVGDRHILASGVIHIW